MNKLKLCAIVTILCASIAIIILSIVYTISGGDIPFDYGIVLDAGSSHTSASLYKWSGQKNKDTGYVSEVVRCSQEPGISAIDDPRLAGYNVLKCIVNVTKSIIPDKYRKSPIPIYLGATAGMRILQEENPEKCDHILDAIEKTFSCLLPDFQINTIDIISGKDEALNSWVSSNYIAGNLIHKNHTVVGETFGVLDMGGASTQIAYQVSASENKMDKSTINETDVALVRLFGVSRIIRASTNLCWGSGEAAKRYLASLIERNQNNFTASCLNKDFEVTLLGSVFKNKVCYERIGENVYDSESTYRFTGLGDPEKCKIEVGLLFTECDKMFTRCPNVQVDMPPSNMTFIAMSSYYYTVRLFKGSEIMSFNDFHRKANNFCRLTMNAALKSDDYDRKTMRRFSCFDCFYVPEYLKKIYKFKDEDWNRFRFIQKIEGTNVGWSLGFMINATNAIPEEAPTPKIPVTRYFIILLILLILLLFCGMLMMVKYFKDIKVLNVSNVP